MVDKLSEAMDVLFRQARTHSAWLDKPVSDDLLRAAYDLAKFGPTSANTMPMRIVFVKSAAAKERLKPALMEGNRDKTMAAPVTAIFADDLKFFEHIPRLFPPAPGMKAMFDKPEAAERDQDSRVPQRDPPERLFHYRRPGGGAGLRADVWIRQCKDRRRVLPRWPTQIQFPDEHRLWRSVKASSAASKTGIR